MNTTITYKISDHPDKEAVIEKHRDIIVDYHGWWDHVYEDWKPKLEGMGFSDPEIEFTGFWSQGDGASFTSRSVPSPHTDPHVMEAWNNLTGAAALIGVSFTETPEYLAYGKVVRTDYRYSHENTVTVEWNWDDPPYGNVMIPDEGLAPFIEALVAAVQAYFEDLDERVGSLCRQIYKDLEDTFSHLTSDEAVMETLEANNYDLDENGEIC